MITGNKKIERVLLVQPPLMVHTDLSSEPKGIHPPIGLGYIAAVVEKDYEIQILDCVVEGFHTEIEVGPNRIRYGLTYDEIRARIESYKPDVVGVSNGFSSGFRQALSVCEEARKVNPEIITVVGGAHPSAVPAEVASCAPIDFVIIGEGEHTFRDLLGNIENRAWSGLDGLAWKGNGDTVVNPKTTFIENLDDLPWPALGESQPFIDGLTGGPAEFPCSGFVDDVCLGCICRELPGKIPAGEDLQSICC